jgi:hypothetical protein
MPRRAKNPETVLAPSFVKHPLPGRRGEVVAQRPVRGLWFQAPSPRSPGRGGRAATGEGSLVSSPLSPFALKRGEDVAKRAGGQVRGLRLAPRPHPAPAFFPSSPKGELSSEALRSETEGFLPQAEGLIVHSRGDGGAWSSSRSEVRHPRTTAPHISPTLEGSSSAFASPARRNPAPPPPAREAGHVTSPGRQPRGAGLYVREHQRCDTYTRRRFPPTLPSEARAPASGAPDARAPAPPLPPVPSPAREAGHVTSPPGGGASAPGQRRISAQAPKRATPSQHPFLFSSLPLPSSRAGVGGGEATAFPSRILRPSAHTPWALSVKACLHITTFPRESPLCQSTHSSGRYLCAIFRTLSAEAERRCRGWFRMRAC